MMRGSAPWWLSVVMLGVGLGVGWLAWGGQEAERPAFVGEDLPGVSSDPSRPAPALRSAEGVRLEGRPAAAGWAESLHFDPVTTPPRGDGVIHGHVFDQAGQPVAGVRVRLDAHADYTRFYPRVYADDPDEELRQRIDGMIAQHQWGRGYRRVTTTAADGGFRFEELPEERQYVLQARADGWQIYPANHEHHRGVAVGTKVDFAARAVARLKLEFAGETPSGTVDVSLHQGSNRRTGMQWTAAQPILDVQPGRYDLYVNAGTLGELRGGPYPVELEAGAAPTVVRVELESAPVLDLHIAFPEGEAMSVELFTLRVNGGGVPTASELRARGQNQRQWRHMMRAVSTEMRMQLKDLKPGTYAIGVARANEPDMAVIDTVTVADGVVEHTIQVPPLDPSRYLLVDVQMPDGSPAKHAQISTGWQGSRGSRSGGSMTAPRPDGRILVMHQPTEDKDDGEGTWWVGAQVQGYGAQRVEYDPRKDRELVLRFEPPAGVSVRVAGVAGTVYEGRAAVSLQASHGGGRGFSGGQRTEIDPEGAGSLAGLQPGRYRALLQIRSGRHGSQTVAQQEVTIRPGENDLALKLPTLHTVTVRGGEGNVRIRPKRERGPLAPDAIRGGSVWQQAGADGVAVFDALLPGSYEAYSGSKRAEFTVPGTREVTLEERKRER